MLEESRLLGKKIAYPESYSPDILVAVPRSLNRDIYGIDKPGELFCGYDSWHAYEASFLLDNGLPACGILKIVYPSDSPFLIESKSLKLYLGSFHMEKMGSTADQAIARFTAQIKTDLQNVLQTEVQTGFYSHCPAERPFDFSDYRILEEEVNQINITDYRERPALLAENIQDEAGEIKVGSHLLKSNCKITGQPDWGSIYIYLKGKRIPAASSLLKYIISMRNENHFHEEICEMVFKRLTDLFQPDQLMVCCLYTRRGGIDICPVRASAPTCLPVYLPHPDLLTASSFRQ